MQYRCWPVRLISYSMVGSFRKSDMTVGFTKSVMCRKMEPETKPSMNNVQFCLSVALAHTKTLYFHPCQYNLGPVECFFLITACYCQVSDRFQCAIRNKHHKWRMNVTFSIVDLLWATPRDFNTLPESKHWGANTLIKVNTQVDGFTNDKVSTDIIACLLVWMNVLTSWDGLLRFQFIIFPMSKELATNFSKVLQLRGSPIVCLSKTTCNYCSLADIFTFCCYYLLSV